MSIYLKELMPDTFRALQSIASERQWPEINPYTEPDVVWYFALRLEFVADTDLNFPHGKWATIQRLQGMVREYASLHALDTVGT